MKGKKKQWPIIKVPCSDLTEEQVQQALKGLPSVEEGKVHFEDFGPPFGSEITPTDMRGFPTLETLKRIAKPTDQDRKDWERQDNE